MNELEVFSVEELDYQHSEEVVREDFLVVICQDNSMKCANKWRGC
jgi:hypothetical protein